jgi:RimJ/RimL family protein N-acetyltransferase
VNAVIVPFSDQYFEQLRQVLDVVAGEKRFLALTEAPARDECFAFYRRLIDNGSPLIVALIENQVVGWCDIQPAFGQARRHVGTLGMGLLASKRGRGIGTELIQAAIARAWSNGLRRIELTVRTDNHAARALYERIGFEHEGVHRNSMFVDGTFYDCYAMALLRRDEA